MHFYHRRLINNLLHSVSVVFVFCCLFIPHWQRLQSGLKTLSVPIVLPLGSPLPAVLMRDALPTQTKPVNYSLPESVMNCYLLLRSGVQMVSGASQPASRDAPGFYLPLLPSPTPPAPHLHFIFIYFIFFGSGSDATWKDMTHTLTLPSVILPSFSGLLHTPDGGHPAPSLNRHSSPVLSAPQAGHWGGSAHPAGAHSHCAGKATTIPPVPPGEKACTCAPNPLHH